MWRYLTENTNLEAFRYSLLPAAKEYSADGDKSLLSSLYICPQTPNEKLPPLLINFFLSSFDFHLSVCPVGFFLPILAIGGGL